MLDIVLSFRLSIAAIRALKNFGNEGSNPPFHAPSMNGHFPAFKCELENQLVRPVGFT